MNRYSVVALIVAVPLWAQAQTLKEIYDAAEVRNLDARQAMEVRQQAEAVAAENWASLFPALSATGGWTHNAVPGVFTIPTAPGAPTETIVVNPANQLDATLRAEVPLIDVGRWERTAAGVAQVRAAAARQSSTRDQVRRLVLSTFFNSVGAEAVLQSAKKSLAVASAQLEFNLSRHQAGVGGELDLERARAEVERNRQLVAEAEAQDAVSRRNLESLSGLVVTRLVPPHTDDAREAGPLADFEGRADGVPVAVAAEADRDAAARTTSSAYVALVPTVSAFAQERFSNATGFQMRTDLFSAGMAFNWRLDLVGIEAIRAQRHAEAAAALAAEKARQVARDQIHSDWQKLRSDLERGKAAQAQVRATARAAQLAHERFAAGVANQVDVIQADRDVFSAEVARTQAWLDLCFDRHALRLSAGLPLEVSDD